MLLDDRDALHARLEVRRVGAARRAAAARDRAEGHREVRGHARAPRHRGEGSRCRWTAWPAHVASLLDEIQEALLARALAFREEHTTRVSQLRRVQSGDGRPARVRHRRLVRQRGVRGADQGRDAGDAAQHPVRRRSHRHLRQVRQAVARRALVRQIVLAKREKAFCLLPCQLIPTALQPPARAPESAGRPRAASTRVHVWRWP